MVIDLMIDMVTDMVIDLVTDIGLARQEGEPLTAAAALQSARRLADMNDRLRGRLEGRSGATTQGIAT